MKNIKESINRVLADWNPIDVPADIAAEEYRIYVPLILQSIESGNNLMNSLEHILRNMIGLDNDPLSNQQLAELQMVCDRIIKAYNDAS